MVAAASHTPINSSINEGTDEELVELVKQGSPTALDFLLGKYKYLVKAKARSYFLIGADREDIVQEGMIGLFKAIRDYREDKISSFRAFADICVTRQIITAIKTATRQKHLPLNSYVSLNRPIFEEETDKTLIDILAVSGEINPEEMMIDEEEMIFFQRKVGKILSPLEWEVLSSYLEGQSYQEIAEDLHKHVKAVDNALQRIKRKMERKWGNGGFLTDL